jgi:glycosyltransferase involved in cell wall biosynthesis
VYNALSPAFWVEANAHRAPSPEKEVILVGSLKMYKGVFQFLELARRLPHRTFRLVVNADEATVRTFFGNTELPKNLSISQGMPSVHPYYQKAAVVLNLSLPDGWVETFGLTALEGMAYGLPVIVPPVGGIAEITPHGQVGYQVDARDINALSDTLEALLSSPGEYARLSSNALEHAKSFSPESFRANILKAFEKVCNSDK